MPALATAFTLVSQHYGLVKHLPQCFCSSCMLCIVWCAVKMEEDDDWEALADNQDDAGWMGKFQAQKEVHTPAELAPGVQVDVLPRLC